MAELRFSDDSDNDDEINVITSYNNIDIVKQEETSFEDKRISPQRSISPIKWEDENEDYSSPHNDIHKSISRSVSPCESIKSRSSKNTVYFLIKSNNYDNVEIAMRKNVWATPKANEYRFKDAFNKNSNVILIFSVRESGAFQGFAKIVSLPNSRLRIDWKLPPYMKRSILGYPFELKWISKKNLSFNDLPNLINTWNENKHVKIGRDGQEIEPTVAKELCDLFEVKGSDLDERNTAIHERLKPRYDSPSRDNRYDKHFNENNTKFRRYPNNHNNDKPYSYNRHHQNYNNHSSNKNLNLDIEAINTFNALQFIHSGKGQPSMNNPNPLMVPNQSILQSIGQPDQIRPLMSIPMAGANTSNSSMSYVNDKHVNSRKHNSRRRNSRSRSITPKESPLERLERLEYEDYVRQASKGIPILEPSIDDIKYQEKVEAFLRGDNRGRSSRRTRSRSLSSEVESYRLKSRRR